MSSIKKVENDLLINIDDLLAGIGEDDLNDFDGLDDFGADDDGDVGFETGSRANQNQFEEQVCKDDTTSDPFFQPSKTPITVGSFTAAGKKLDAPSASSIDRVRRLFDDDPTETRRGGQGNINKRHKLLDSTPSTFPPPSSSFSLTAHTNVPFKSTPGPSRQQNRPTPSGSSLIPSQTSTDTVSCMFTGIDDELNFTPSSFKIPPSAWNEMGFQTGSGKPAPKPSSASMARAMAIFAEEDLSLVAPISNKSSPLQVKGFQTGSGKAVPTPSSKSIARGLALFAETDEQPIASSSTIIQPPIAPQHSTTPHSPVTTTMRVPPSAFARPNSKMATPTRLPLRTTTNTFIRPTLPSTPQLHKNPIDIKTPASGNSRRIGLGTTPRSTALKTGNKGFVTPFKKGAASMGAPGSHLRPSTSNLRETMLGKTPQRQKIEVIFEPVFNLTRAHLRPRFYTTAELKELGLPDEIWTLTLENAIHYLFIGQDASVLGNEAALALLKYDKCTLANQRWVDNHWCMILWKLAGQVAAKPGLFDLKWNWFEVTNQLKYRYEREFGAAQRPIVRRIQERDSSAAVPMVLVVNNICYSKPKVDENRASFQPRPYLVLSDGWYRIKAQLDECLVRAVRRGKIAVGRKLGISGAKLESSGDAKEVLDAFEVSRLSLSGNSCHLAKWDTRLGIKGSPFISSLSSLSVDGGNIALMDLMIDKVFPLAFVNSDKANREAPWDEDEEQRKSDAWQDYFESERQRLNTKMQQGLSKIQDLANLLASYKEDMDGPIFSDDDVSENIDDEIDSLLNAPDPRARMRNQSGTMTNSQIIHLSHAIQSRLSQDISKACAEMERELQTTCPPRNIRNFRQLRVSDGQEGRKAATRTSLLTVWDAKIIGADVLVEGRRFFVSNLIPAKNGDWRLPRLALTMKNPTKFEINLHTRRDTRWIPVGLPSPVVFNKEER